MLSALFRRLTYDDVQAQNVCLRIQTVTSNVLNAVPRSLCVVTQMVHL